MNVGMLWFDDDSSTTLAEKIVRASSYYADKYGKPPNHCFLRTQGSDEFNLDGIAIETSSAVLPDHFWLGVKD